MLTIASNAQQIVKIGESTPNLLFNSDIGGQPHTARLVDFSGKLILLDFWGVNCEDCIVLLPHMLELQKQFGDKLKIYVVTYNSKPEVEKLWQQENNNVLLSPEKKVALLKAAKELSFIYDDSVLTKIFPHTGIPTHVWIDRRGTYRAITFPSTTTEENIAAFLRGEEVRLANIHYNNVDERKPFTWLNHNSNGHQQYYNILTGGVRTSLSNHLIKYVDSATQKLDGLSIMNQSVVSLYKLAYFKGKSADDYNVFLDAKNSDKYYPPRNVNIDLWMEDNQFNYASRIPVYSKVNVYEQMAKDLDRFLGLQSNFKEKKVKCLILKRISPNLKSINVDKQQSFVRSNAGLFRILSNTSMDDLVSQYLQNIVKENIDPFMPVINKTGYAGRIDMMLPFNYEQPLTVTDLHKALRPYGLDLVAEYQIRKVLVIKNRKQ